MRNNPNTPPPATTQAPPASSIFDPLLWEWLKPAFGRYMAIAGGRIAGAHNDALDCINRDVHEWQLRLGFKVPDSMTIRVPDAVECRKLTVKAASNWEEAVWIEPYHEGRCYAWRADLGRRTTLPAAPAAHAGGELEPALPALPSPQAEPVSPSAETGQEESPPMMQPSEMKLLEDRVAAAAKWMAPQLNEHSKVEDLRAACMAKFNLTRSAVDKRVWPAARAFRGWSPRATPGAKPARRPRKK